VLIAAGYLGRQIENYFRNHSIVEVLDVGSTGGPADSLAAAMARVDDERLLVLYGDTVVSRSDLARLERQGNATVATVLAAPLGAESPTNWICCAIADGRLLRIKGHPREAMTHRVAALTVSDKFRNWCTRNSGRFEAIEVGMMPPLEAFLESSLVDLMADGQKVAAVEAKDVFLDVDKPWHLLEAAKALNKRRCGEIEGQLLAEGAEIDPTARIRGNLRLGRNSRIGHGVLVEGDLWVGDETVIENGAILSGNNVIGDGCRISNYCLVGADTAIGDGCVVEHCAEVSGLAMEGVYLYHYMELSGVIGAHTDLGAGTVCGTLRFDDSSTIHRVKGHPEIPPAHANAVYLGDYCRTGVNATLMPGCKVGTYGIVGPGVVLREDVPDRTMVLAEQTLMRREWGPERYGW
jgi:bifunctional UDP-N-acetylglucosamine pyrophosphorylase/glucosamine-1-phosphate N-acetyltransferase